MVVKYKTMSLITYGKGYSFDIKKFEPIENYYTKPRGGLWASPTNSKYGWKHWCESENFNLENLGSFFTFKYSGNIYTIDGIEDMLTLPWYCLNDLIWFPDFEKMLKQGIGAIHLTIKGERETRFSFPKNLYGWDCESVLIFNIKQIDNNIN